MFKKLLIVICFIFASMLNAQNQTANWYFGEEAGLTFNSGFPNDLEDGAIDTIEGCSSISNRQGQLLFYTDGITVWNKSHSLMVNGTGLRGDNSSTQSAIIIPKPDDDDIFYIFTVDDRGRDGGMRFSEIDMTLDTGLGAVTVNKNILLETSVTEKVTAVESADGLSIWVISHRWNSNEFVAYLVTNTGVNTTPIISAVGSTHTGDINNTIGYLKASPNREKVACVRSYFNSQTEVFDFNAATGVLSNPIAITNYTTTNIGAYGCEFSPDSKLLYVTELNYDTNLSYLHQYNLTLNTASQIINSDVIISEEDGRLGAIQQALDGRLYLAKFGSRFLNVIKNPNTIGLDCNYEEDSVSLGEKVCRFGLPPFIQSYFFATNIFENTCFGDITSFSIDTSTVINNILWDFGDPASGTNNTSNSINTTHQFSNSGTYNITIQIDTQGETQFVYRTLTISNPPPILSLATQVICEGNNNNSLDLTSTIPQSILDNPDYIISFYNDQSDAIIRENSIVSPTEYNSPQNNTNVYIRLDNANGDCYSLSELEFDIIETPLIEDYEAFFFCDDNATAQILIDVGNLEFPLNNYNFLWLNSNETTPQIQVNQNGTYTVRITLTASITIDNPDGCYADRTVQVNSSSIATITNIEISGTTATVFTSGIGNYQYTLDDVNGIYQNSNVFTNVTPGVHAVYVRDLNTCGIATAEFSLIDFPSFFTPNNDTFNDYWQVYGVSGLFQSNSKILIFDRFGKLIKQIKPNSLGWDGNLDGKPLPENDYWFSVTLQDGRIFKDHFTLKR